MHHGVSFDYLLPICLFSECFIQKHAANDSESKGPCSRKAQFLVVVYSGSM